MKEFDLNIGKILEDWEIYHAIREIIANALDEQLLTNTAQIEIAKTGNAWCIRDFGRGLNYHHLTQNENPEKTDNDKVIGRFGVGLKDALATLFRHNIGVEIQSKYGMITLKESTKNTFDDIVTLHAQIAPPADIQMLGTAFYVYDCPDHEIDKAKRMFLCFSNEEIIETTSYGQIIAKASDTANIYINGVKVAEEPNFAFSYNITALSKQIKKALNRERTNVGRTAYADRIKSILLEATNKEVVRTLSDNLESMSDGGQCDEIKWVDVAAYVVKELNDSDDTVFVTPDELANSSGSTTEILQNSGKRIVFVPESVKKKAEQESDGEISTIKTVVQDYNESFSYSFVDVENLTELEKKNWQKIPVLLEKLGLSEWFTDCLISEQLKEDLDNTVGVWDHELQKIIILRTQLKDAVSLFGTVLHEIIHAKTGASDVSRFFECELTNMIGQLSVMCSSDTHTVEKSQFDVQAWLDSNIVDNENACNHDIDVRRVALLSLSGDIHWCVDCFGLLSVFTEQLLQNPSRNYCVENYNRKCAFYEENGASYWLVYNYSDQPSKDFLYVTTIENMLNLDNTQGVTVYDGSEIALLHDFMQTSLVSFGKEHGFSKKSTYNAYLSIIRNLLIVAEKSKKRNVWIIAEQIRKECSECGEDLKGFIDNHVCPVCGCYFTSYECECVRCGFDGINTEAMNDSDYVEIWKNKPQECRSLVEKSKEGLKVEGSTLIGFDKRYKCETLVIPMGISKIASGAFKECPHIKRIYLPDSLKTIEKSAFSECSNLESIHISQSVNSIESGAFHDCDTLTSINVNVSNQTYLSIDGNLYSKDGTILLQYAIGKTDRHFIIPGKVKTIGDDAFWGCSCVEMITFSDSVEEVGKGAFTACVNLKNVKTGFELKNICPLAFAHCSNLENVFLNLNVTNIGRYAFYKCESLKIIILPPSVKEIQESAFQECIQLHSIEITQKTLEKIGQLAFANCDNLRTISYLNGTVTEWGLIEKAEYWDYKTGQYTVQCKDGIKSKPCKEDEDEL